MTADTCQRVYAFVADYRTTHRHAPDARQAYHALGLTKREYYAVLRFLERCGFVQRDRHGLWRSVVLHAHACATCQRSITPANAVYVTARGRTYLRRDCATCYNAKATVRQRVWRAKNPTYDTVQQKRVRRQQRSATV